LSNAIDVTISLKEADIRRLRDVGIGTGSAVLEWAGEQLKKKGKQLREDGNDLILIDNVELTVKYAIHSETDGPIGSEPAKLTRIQLLIED
jgi:hypothetical protein